MERKQVDGLGRHRTRFPVVQHRSEAFSADAEDRGLRDFIHIDQELSNGC